MSVFTERIWRRHGPTNDWDMVVQVQETRTGIRSAAPVMMLSPLLYANNRALVFAGPHISLFDAP